MDFCQGCESHGMWVWVTCKGREVGPRQKKRSKQTNTLSSLHSRDISSTNKRKELHVLFFYVTWRDSPTSIAVHDTRPKGRTSKVSTRFETETRHTTCDVGVQNNRVTKPPIHPASREIHQILHTKRTSANSSIVVFRA